MSRQVLVELAQRTIAHTKAGTVPLAGNIGRVAASNYYEPERWQREMDLVFKRLPLVLGFSCEFSEPNRYKAMEVAGIPILLTRADDGTMRSFVNMCSHRGAVIMPEGTGTSRRFTCPYHAWSYDSTGNLVGVLDRDEFGDLDPSCHGLTPLPVTERAGIVFGCLDHASTLDESFVDTFLCGYGEMLDQLRLADCTFVASQQVDGPNWKVAYDGYLDFYHLPILHKNTFGPDYSNKAIYDAWGPHQRVTSPDERMLSLEEVPTDQWSHELLTSGVWTIFPHTSIASFKVGDDEDADAGGRMYLISTLFPGPDPDTSTTIQTFLAAFEPQASLAPAIKAQREFLLRVVRDEDYYTGNRIQRSVKTGAKTEFLFGRNEAGGQRFHGFLERLLVADSDDDLVRLFSEAEVAFQR